MFLVDNTVLTKLIDDLKYLYQKYLKDGLIITLLSLRLLFLLDKSDAVLLNKH